MNALVKQLLDQMSVSKDGTTKFVFDQYRGRYWFINIYKTQFPEYEEITTIDTGLPDKERITELENLVKSMSAQMHYMRTSQEKLERQLMESEHTNTQHHLFNIELKIQVDETKREKKWAEDKLNEKIISLQFFSEIFDFTKNENFVISFETFKILSVSKKVKGL